MHACMYVGTYMSVRVCVCACVLIKCIFVYLHTFDTACIENSSYVSYVTLLNRSDRWRLLFSYIQLYTTYQYLENRCEMANARCSN